MQNTRNTNQNQMPTVVPNPTQIWIEPTTRCNTRCIHCVHFESNFGQDIDIDLYEKIRDQVLDHVDRIQLIGVGEPLLSRFFWGLFDDCVKGNIEIHTCSNGILLQKDEYVSKLVKNPVVLTVSIDGACKETYEFVRPYIKWENMIASLACIREHARTTGRNKKFKLRFNFCAMKNNIRDLPQLVLLAKKYGACEIVILPLAGQTFLKGIGDQSLHDSSQVLFDAFKSALSLANRYNIHLNIPPSFHNLIVSAKTPLPQKINYQVQKLLAMRYKIKNQGLSKSLKTLKKRIKSKISNQLWSNSQHRHSTSFAQFCHFPWSDTYFAADGRVFPCCIVKQELGHLGRQDWQDIWHGQAYQNIRRTIHSWNPSRGCRYSSLPSGINGGDEMAYDKFFDRYDRRIVPLHSRQIQFGSGFFPLEYLAADDPSHIWMDRKGEFSLIDLSPNDCFVRLLICSLDHEYGLNPGYCQINQSKVHPFDNTFTQIHFPIENPLLAEQKFVLKMENILVDDQGMRHLCLAICGVEVLSQK